jgi:predicted small secreted protein
MGQKEGSVNMTKKGLAFFVLLVFIILISGCETIKGAGQGAADGAKKDWQTLKKADAWMRKNLW